MHCSKNQQLEDLISTIDEEAKKALSKEESERLAPLFRAYFEEAELADLQKTSPLDLFGATMAHLHFSQQRLKNQYKVRVYNPDIERHGWQSTHTVIEIVNDDMPFLIDTLAMLLAKKNLTLHLLVHPVLAVARDEFGEIQEVRRTENRDLPLESFIHAEVDRVSDPVVLKALEDDVNQALQDVQVAVHDASAMRDKLHAIAAEFSGHADNEQQEASHFLEWLADNHFLLQGYCDYDLIADQAGFDALKIVQGSGLGILRNQGVKAFSESFAQLPSHLRELAHHKTTLVLNKSQTYSNIHRPAYLDYIGIKRYDEQGEVIGERRFLGLYTASAYQVSPRNIPVLRQKIASVVKACDYVDDSYKAKTLNFVLENYPRDELFEIPAELLTPIAQGLVSLQERPRTRLFTRRDHFQRYVSCLVFVPRDSFNTELRLKIEKLLVDAYHGSSVDFNVTISDVRLARVHYIIRTSSAEVLQEISEAEIEEKITHIVRGWGEELHQQLLGSYGEEAGNRLFYCYRSAFPISYREEFSIRNAALDISTLEKLSAENPLAVKLYRPLNSAKQSHHLKVFRFGEPISLSSSLPTLENLGVTVQDEHPYRIVRADGTALWINDFGLTISNDAALESDLVRQRFQEILLAVASHQAESDGFNRLVLAASLDWHEVALIRALAKYLRQGGLTFSQQYIEQCVVSYPQITATLVSLFRARLDPLLFDLDQASALQDQIYSALESVVNLDEDRILRGLLTVILAIRRTNFWQKNSEGTHKAYLSFKFESAAIDFLPEPRPLYEIWVYSPRVEGVHLRGSKVARGGLRWSDRMEDFRTEVLGLVKAQMVKNSVIVPMGSKGGFVCKQLPSSSDREAWLAEGIACYRTFISALLDLTDNLVSGRLIPPNDTLRTDGDDPYLVVAADKGTATFSDIANAVSQEYGFWLGDAFASGGSAGYDHKKMGITARGAWEAVKRHFRHLGINTQTQDFSVIGIGDMSGDVFGNGMLLSEHICLVAAFDHRHIFLDPAPNAATSFAERARLFNLPRSSWQDYNADLISEGGGVFSRSAKSIRLSPQIKAWLGVDCDAMTPSDLIHQILKAPADLLYNGGIGTYVKAHSQSHAEVNDRANDAIRVDARDLRVRVVGEGGNLGLTQFGRIEFALAGGQICSDAIDNSAGVDCSDHEVNIKILLGSVIQAGDMTLKQRNQLLAEMTEEVGALVLRNNYLQTQILAINRASAAQMLSAQSRMMAAMEKAGHLKRRLEFLPSEEQISERRLAHQGLTMPEVAVLLAYSKISLDQALLASDLPDDPDFLPILIDYFPRPLREKFASAMVAHHLRREIIANQLANRIVNRMGTTFIFRLQEEGSVNASDIAKAFWAADKIFGGESLWQQIEALDNVVSADLQVEMMIAVRTMIERAVRWLLRQRRVSGRAAVTQLVNQYHTSVNELMQSLAVLVPGAEGDAVSLTQQRLESAGVPPDLSALLSRLDYAIAAFDVVELSESGHSLFTVAQTYYALGESLQLGWLRDAITRLPRDNRWQALARSALRDDLYRLHRDLTAGVLQCSENSDTCSPVEVWLGAREAELDGCQQLLLELRTFPNLDLAMLSAGMRELSNRLMA